MEYLTSNFYIRFKKNAVKLILITHVMLFSKKYIFDKLLRNVKNIRGSYLSR